MNVDYLIIGTGIAGTTAAETIRSRDAAGTILLVGNEPHRLYSRVLLPNLIKGRPEETVFLKKADFYEAARIETALGISAARLDAAGRIVTLSDGRAVGYKKLLIATGGSPRRLTVPGSDQVEPLSFQTLDDARRIKAALGGRAVVVGGGFIALELLMAFVHHGIPVTAVVRGDGFFSRTLDVASRRKVMAAVQAGGVVVRTGAEIAGVEAAGSSKTVHLSTGERLDCTALGVGIGLDLNVGWLDGSGLEIRHGLVVDERLRTNDPAIFAAGDVAEFYDPLAGRHHLVGNWTNALLQGKQAGLTMTGDDRPFEALTSYHITCFGLPIGFFGATSLAGGEHLVREYPDGAILQILVAAGRIIGATVVGPFAERAALTALMKSKRVWSDRELGALADARTPLAALLDA